MTGTIRLLIVLVAACGGGGSPTIDASGSGSGSLTCTVNATATANTSNRTITGVGTITCDATGALKLDVCVQWNSTGAFTDIMCLSSNMSGVKDLRVENVSSCGLGSGRRFRTRVTGTVNGTARPEVLSSEVGCE